MDIVVLDGYTLNPGDLSWDGFAELGNLILYDRTAPEDIISRIGGAEIVITNKTPLTEAVFAACPNLRYVGVLATGYNVVDVEAASRRRIAVTNIPSYGTAAVAQFTFALLLEICHQVGRHSGAVHGGKWTASADFCFWETPLTELAGKTMGIIGYGRIGSEVGRIARCFGMEVLAATRHREAVREAPDTQCVSLEELLSRSDVVSLHCPLLPETQGMIGEKAIARMKDGVILLNTARGPLLDERAVANALESGKIAYAAVDVLSAEPPREDNPLLAAPHCIITPHMAWAPKESRIRLMGIAVENLRAFLNGLAKNVVN